MAAMLIIPEQNNSPIFSVYLEVEVGGKSKDDFLIELKTANMFIAECAEDMMSQSVWKPGKREQVKFARAKVSDFSFTHNPTTAELGARIQELGHSLCEPCDGPSIRLALKDQSAGDYFWCAMEQIIDSQGRPDLFEVERDDDGKAWLYGYWVYPEDKWTLNTYVIFRLRK